MIPSPIYWTATGYDLVMRLLYARDYHRLYADVAALIPDGASVVDVCCGSARLKRGYLRGRDVRYLGLDHNPLLVRAVRRAGVEARVFDLRRERPPRADYVVMCSSFYHFLGARDAVLDTLLEAAREAVVISEPVRNLTSHPVPAVRTVASWLTNPGGGHAEDRFDAASFGAFARARGATEFLYEPGARQAVAVFRRAGAPV